MSVLSSEELDYLRGISVSDLMQSYTRVSATLGAEDEYGNKVRVDGAQSPGLACYFKPEGTRAFMDTGPLVTTKPTLYHNLNDGLKQGDHVANILDEKGILIDAGPFRVMSIRASGGLLWSVAESELERHAMGVRV